MDDMSPLNHKGSGDLDSYGALDESELEEPEEIDKEIECI